jgi:hypothetical protein
MAVYVVSIALEPRRLETVTTFQAADPWNGGAAADFELDRYKMMPAGARVVRAGSVWGNDVYGIRSRLDGVDRILPEALSELYQTRRVEPEQLPRLYAALQPTLRTNDFQPLLHVQIHKYVAAAFVVLALVLALLAITAGGGHTSTRLPLREWLARPQVDGESILTDAPVDIKGMTEANFTPLLPPKLFAMPASGRYLLAAFPAGDGHRLLLAPAEQVGALPHLALMGVTVSPASIGVPESALAELRRALPNVDTRLVTGLFWSWTDASSAQVARSFFGVLAPLCLASAALVYFMVAVRQARRRRQLAWLLARL